MLDSVSLPNEWVSWEPSKYLNWKFHRSVPHRHFYVSLLLRLQLTALYVYALYVYQLETTQLLHWNQWPTKFSSDGKHEKVKHRSIFRNWLKKQSSTALSWTPISGVSLVSFRLFHCLIIIIIIIVMIVIIITVVIITVVVIIINIYIIKVTIIISFTFLIERFQNFNCLTTRYSRELWYSRDILSFLKVKRRWINMPPKTCKMSQVVRGIAWLISS